MRQRQASCVAFSGSGFGPGVRATGVELVPEVARFADQFFAEANGGFGSSADTRLVVDDARDFLRASPRQYDVIVGDLVVPWRPGESSLYTREHFANARQALAGDGLICVWLPMFQLSEPQFRIILNTFLAEFPKAFVWRGDFSPGEPALGLIAFRDPSRTFDPSAVSRRLALMRPDPFNPQLKHPGAFWMHLAGLLTRESFNPSEARINSENLPWLELRGRASPGRESSEHFVGRPLRQWENEVRANSIAPLIFLGADALAGVNAGTAMTEYTLLLSEGRQAEAKVLEQRARELLGADAAREVFGPAR